MWRPGVGTRWRSWRCRRCGDEVFVPQRWRKGRGELRWENGPGQGAKTAAARLAALLEDNCMVQQQGKLDSQDTDGLMSRKRKKTRRSYWTRAQQRGEPGVELWVATATWQDSRGHGGVFGTLRSWVVSSVRGQRSDVEAGPPQASQWRAHSPQSLKAAV